MNKYSFTFENEHKDISSELGAALAFIDLARSAQDRCLPARRNPKSDEMVITYIQGLYERAGNLLAMLEVSPDDEEVEIAKRLAEFTGNPTPRLMEGLE